MMYEPAPAPILEEVENIIRSWKMDEEDTAWLLRQFAALSRRVAELEANAATYSQAYGLVVAQREEAEAKCREHRARTLRVADRLHVKSQALRKCCATVLAERAKSARLGSAKEKLAKRLHDTRVKLSKVECEATRHYEDMRRMQGRVEAQEKACRRQVENIERWLQTGVPAGPGESKEIYEQLKAALTATEAK